MAERKQPTENTEDSFEALLRRAAQPSRVGRRVLLPIGSRLAGGRLEITRRIGEGGMGIVYEAFDAERRANVALKTLSRLDSAGIYRLKAEFRALADVSHPNLVQLHELFAQNEHWFFTMELVPGARFDEWVRPGAAMDEARIRAALPQLAEAVRAIHDAGKLHRDLKPGNVLVTSEGRLVVLDFGLAADPEVGGTGQTRDDDGISGTPAYMAPEQAAGRPATTASDFYAVGVMLFEALTGKLPFDGRTAEILVAKQTHAAPAVIDENPAAPEDLATLCAALLSRDPVARPGGEALPGRLRPASGSTAEFMRAPDPRPSIPASAELLGRETELDLLRDAYRATLAGTPVVSFVSGESGIGKSALVEAFLSELRADGRSVVLSGRCYERENVPYKAFDALVDELSRYLRRLPAKEAAALLPREVFALAHLFPVLNRLSVVADAPQKVVPDPDDLQRRAFGAFGELFARIRDRRPLIAFIDDLQWTDWDSVRLMRHLLVHPDPIPMLLVVAHRSEGAADNALLQSVLEAGNDNPALSARRLVVGPLGEGALSALASGLLATTPHVEIASAIGREAQGSPFFAAELARAALLRDERRLAPSLEEALSLHIGSLSAGARRLLSVLALAGQPLVHSIVLDAAGMAAAHAELDVLRNERLVRFSTATDRTRKVECYHDKIRELVASRLDGATAREVSSALSGALKARDDADPELLTRCLLGADLPEQAARYAATAAERAMRAMAFDRAARLYEQALLHGRFEAGHAHRLRVCRAAALAHAGQGLVAAEAYLQARESDDANEAVELTRKAGEQYLICGKLARGRELLDEALRPLGLGMPQGVATTFASMLRSRTRLRIRGLRFVPRKDQDQTTLRQLEALRNATHCLIRSDLMRAADLSARWVRLALDSGHEIELARGLAWETELLGLMGASERRVERMELLAETLCNRTGDPLAREWFHHGRGIYRAHGLGRMEAAIEDFDRCLELSAAEPSTADCYDRPWVEWQRALCCFWLGRLSELIRVTPTALEAAWARSDSTLIPAWACMACFTYLALDAPGQAARELERARRVWQQDEVTVQDLQLVICSLMPGTYRGDARSAWNASESERVRIRSSFFARVAFSGATDAWSCGAAAAAAAETRDAAERRELLREAKRSARRAKRALGLPTGSPPVDPVLACARGDAEAAIRALREALEAPKIPPLSAYGVRRRLGVLLGGDEGMALVLEADSFFRNAGVIDPQRFVAALVPGVDLNAV